MSFWLKTTGVILPIAKSSIGHNGMPGLEIQILYVQILALDLGEIFSIRWSVVFVESDWTSVLLHVIMQYVPVVN